MEDKIQFWWGFFHGLYVNIYHFLEKIKFNLYTSPKRRSKNKHNRTTIESNFDFNKVKVGNYTYWPLDIRLGPSDKNYVKIWNYCLIAPKVEFICWVDHSINHLMNYPLWSQSFRASWKLCKMKHKKYSLTQYLNFEHTYKWPIIIDDDVWLGKWSKIMSWVHIWQWAVIGAWAVVTKDIPPYAIVWWVPAKVIKYRFSEEKIKKLLKIDYSKIAIEKLREIYDETIKDDFDIEQILGKLNKVKL